MNKVGLKLLVLTILAILVMAFLYFQKNWSDQKSSHQFIGQVKEIKNNTITASGYFFLDDSNQPTDTKPKEAQILVNDSTTFIKKVIYREVRSEKTSKPLDFQKFHKEELVKNLQDLTDEASNTHGLDISVSTNQNIFGKNSFIAARVSYTVEIYR